MQQLTKRFFVIKYLIAGLFIIVLSIAGMAQITVTGKITDKESGEALIGVNVILKGTFKGTATNLDGNYTLVVPNSLSVIQATYIGYDNIEKEVGNQTAIDFQMELVHIDVEEVVVIGYGAIKKSDITGAVSSVGTKEITKMVVPSAEQALQGRASGVQVTANSGKPGGSFDIKIRGTGTINNSSPLFVVDGMIVEDISHIAPENIQDFQVLKDAGSAAIYGSRAANGVILITTKTGSEGSAIVKFSTSYSMQNFEKVTEMMDGNEYMMMDYLNRGDVKEANRVYDIYKQNLTPQEMYYQVNGVKARDDMFVNWLDQISRIGGIQKYNLSVSGGTQKVKYYISGSLYDQKGIVINSSFNDKTLLSDFDFSITDKLNLRTNISYASSARRDASATAFSNALLGSPVVGMYEPSGRGYLTYNPYTDVLWNNANENRDLLTLNLQLNYKFSKALTFSSRGIYYRRSAFGGSFKEPNEEYYYALYTGTTRENYNSAISRHYNINKRLQWENILTFIKQINLHSINAVGVVALESSDNQNIMSSNYSALAIDSNSAYLESGYTLHSANGGASQSTDLGLVTRVNYGYADKYLVQFNLRADASSRFIQNRWGFFPSLSLGWRLSQEEFLSLPKWIDMLKIRGSWGQLGNNRIDEYAAYTRVSSGYAYAFGTETQADYVSGWAPNSIAYDNIQWERTTTYNVATDIGLFKSVVIDFEYFRKYTSDMLVRVPIPPSNGISSDSYPFRNAGEVLNKGFELTLDYKNNIRKLNYDLNWNISYIQNEITKLGEQDEPIWSSSDGNYFRVKNQVGHPIGEFYGFVTDGLRNDGQFKFVDTNGDGVINDFDRQPIGNPQPKFFSGLNITLDYHGFDLTMFVQGVFGQQVFNELMNEWSSFGSYNMLKGSLAQMHISDSKFTGINPELITWYPDDLSLNTATLPTFGSDVTYNFKPSDVYVEDASYVRLKNVQIGYTFPKRISRRIKMDDMRVYVGGMNLLTFTKYSGLDPEIGTDVNNVRGFDNGIYPQARTFTMGFNVSF
jgi:TonB-linked SusC/RagA family outer membrane protein